MFSLFINSGSYIPICVVDAVKDRGNTEYGPLFVKPSMRNPTFVDIVSESISGTRDTVSTKVQKLIPSVTFPAATNADTSPRISVDAGTSSSSNVVYIDVVPKTEESSRSASNTKDNPVFIEVVLDDKKSSALSNVGSRLESTINADKEFHSLPHYTTTASSVSADTRVGETAAKFVDIVDSGETKSSSKGRSKSEGFRIRRKLSVPKPTRY